MLGMLIITPVQIKKYDMLTIAPKFNPIILYMYPNINWHSGIVPALLVEDIHIKPPRHAALERAMETYCMFSPICMHR